ncbi:unnamed protein product, partial [Choristocarpus tenellus]
MCSACGMRLGLGIVVVCELSSVRVRVWILFCWRNESRGWGVLIPISRKGRAVGGAVPGTASRVNSVRVESVVGDAVDLLGRIGDAVALLNDSYNAALNATQRRGGHDNPELGRAVLWTLWSRLVRLHVYLRQLLVDTPAQALPWPVAVRKGDWGMLV